MLAIDTSSLVSFLTGDLGPDTALTKEALQNSQLYLPPPVLSEILSTPNLGIEIQNVILQMPLLELKDGFWKRAGELRRNVLKKKLKARLGDSLIAQVCLDYAIPLITRDGDFKNIQVVARLKILGLPR